MSQNLRPEVNAGASSEGYQPHQALVHVLTPEYMGRKLVDYDEVTDQMFALAAPNQLRHSLVDVRPKPDSNVSLSYTPAFAHRSLHLAVTAREYSILARHVPTLATNTAAMVKAKAEEAGHIIIPDEVLAKAERGALDTVRKKRARMSVHLRDKIIPRIELLERFGEMAEFPNLSRGNLQTMQSRVRQLHHDIFGDMLLAMIHYRGWDSATASKVAISIDKRLFVGPNQVENFAGMVDLANEYYGHKRALIMGRIADAMRYERNRLTV